MKLRRSVSAVGHSRETRVTAPDASRAFFDQQVRAALGISGDEFVRRWDSGELTISPEDPDHGRIMRLLMLKPVERAQPQ